MRAVALGAGGGMGRVASQHLAPLAAIHELVLADLSLDAAQRTASTIADAAGSISTTSCDLLDEAAARELLDRADVVVNCAGPFFRLGVPALRAAIATGTRYLDICDDPDPTVDMLGLDAEARSTGVEAVIGMGASPGLSNLLAVRASRELDTVEDCITAWALETAPGDAADAADLEAPGDGAVGGAVIHFMEQIHGEVLVVEGGAHVRRPPLEAVPLTYPGGRRGTGYVVGHPEPITLLDSLALTGRCANVVLVSSGSTAAYLRRLQRDLDRGELTLDEAGRLLLEPSALRGARALAEGRRLGGIGELPPFFALLHGDADGTPTTVACHVTTLPRGMAGATAVPAALAVAQLLERPPSPGVHPPERVIDGDRLLRDLIPHCADPVETVDDLAPVTATPR